MKLTLKAISGQSATLADAQGSHELHVGDTLGGWRLQALVPGEPPLAVLEQTRESASELAWLSAEGLIRRMNWDTGRLEALESPAPGNWPPEYIEQVLAAREDLLGCRVLTNGEVDPEAVRVALPPLVDYSFLCDRRLPDKPIIDPNGTVRGFFDADRQYEPGDPETAWRWTLLDATLPAVVTAFHDRRAGLGREQISFVALGDSGQPVVWVRLRSLAGECEYLRSEGQPEPCAAADWYRALLAMADEQDTLLAPAMRLALPDREVANGARASLLRGFHTFVGDHPKYGVLEYAKDKHDGFPPSVLSLAGCALEWGLFDDGKRLLSYWLRRFVRDDGAFDYYGPALSEYGQMLALMARCQALTGDARWLQEHAEAGHRIARRLLRLRAESLAAHPAGSPLRGLIPCNPEADYTDRQMPIEAYYSGDAWAWRGLKEFAAALGDTGEAAKYAAEAAAYRADIQSSIEQSLHRDLDPPYLPPVAGMTERYETLTESTPSSYANYRFYPELLSSGLLTPAQAESVLHYRLTRGGDLLGTTRFWDCLDDWPVANYAWGLMQADRADRVRLLLYGHLFHHHAQGTQTAYEMVRVNPEGQPVRRLRSDYCVCTQLIVPLIVKWMIAWEPWDEEVLWLNRATPRAWQRAEGGCVAEGLPTRWGPVSLRVQETDDSWQAEVTVRDEVPKLCLRLNSRRWGHITVNAERQRDFDVQTGTLTITSARGDLRIVAGE